MKCVNETHEKILQGIHELIINRKGSDSHAYEDGWFDALIDVESIINSTFQNMATAPGAEVSSVSENKSPDLNADVHAAQPKIKGVVVLVRGKPIYQPIETVNKPAVKQSGNSIDHPDYYNTGKIEVIDFLEDQNLPFHLGNAVKYICRAGKKDPHKTVEDLKKAVWYINRYINLVLDTPDPEVSRHD